MTSIERLPTEIFVEIFSFFKKYELLVVEKTCSQWKTIIQEHIWDPMTCIDCESVGLPQKGCFEHFLKIVNRAKHVKEFFYVLKEMRGKARSAPKLQDRVKWAQTELLRKRTADAAFPLHDVEDLLKSGLKKPCGKMTESEACSQVDQLMEELQFSTFEVVEIDDLSLHDPRSDYNRFIVSCCGNKVDIPLKENQVTRLEIGCLVLSLAPSCWPAVTASQNVLSQLMNLKQLETVNIRSILMSLPSKTKLYASSFAVHNHDDNAANYEDGEIDDDGMSITVYFHSHSCVLTADDFLSLLKSIATNDDHHRIQQMVQLVKRWQNNRSCVETAELTVYNSEIDRFEHLLRAGGDLNMIPVSQKDSLQVLNELFWSVIDHLNLFVRRPRAIEDDIILRLLQTGKFKRLKKFGISIAPHDDAVDMTPADHEVEAEHKRNLLRRLASSLHHLEELSLGLFVSDPLCSSSAFEPDLLVSRPLPLLKTVDVDGALSFPFVLSLVQHAPNLIDLNVSSREFEDKQAGLEWMLQLLRAVGDCRHLKYLHVSVEKRENGSETSYQRVKRSSPTHHQDSDLLDEIQRQIEHLKTVSPKLKMTIDY